MPLPAERRGTEAARPLSALKALIKENLRKADEAASQAALPFWQAAGAELNEARAHDWSNADEFWEWATRSFNKSKAQLGSYMREATATGDRKFSSARPTTLSDAMRTSGREPRGSERGGAGWQAPVQEKLEAFNWTRYNQEQAEKAKEQQLINKLMLEMLDIGYKVLAAKFHPDKQTGSAEAMQRLNAARKQAKDRLT